MIPTPGQTKKHYGIGAVNYHTGETLVLVRRRKRRKEMAELLESLLEKHPKTSFTWPGIMPIPIKMMKWKPWFAGRLGV